MFIEFTPPSLHTLSFISNNITLFNQFFSFCAKEGQRFFFKKNAFPSGCHCPFCRWRYSQAHERGDGDDEQSPLELGLELELEPIPLVDRVLRHLRKGHASAGAFKRPDGNARLQWALSSLQSQEGSEKP